MTAPSSKVIPVFYAADDAYAPLLGVSLLSLISNAKKTDQYKIHVIASNMSSENREKIASLERENVAVVFEDLEDKLSALSDRLAIRDYYSASTYLRIFIANAFPEYDKAIYIDSDTVVDRDISEMFLTDVGDALVGAVQENVMLLPVFGEYSEKVLKIPRKKYFNAGILTMNLKKMREIDLEARFVKLLSERSFPVAQDQDYLNVLCKDQVYYFPYSWNLMPAENMRGIEPYIVHYKMAERPWHYDGIDHGDIFWKYAEKSAFYEILREIKSSRTPEDEKKDKETFENLVKLALDEISREERRV